MPGKLVGQNLYGIIYHGILRLDDSAPNYRRIPNPYLLNLLAETENAYNYSKQGLDYLMAKIWNNFPPRKTKSGQFEQYKLQNTTSRAFEELIWEKYFQPQLPVVQVYEEQNRKWFVDKKTSAKKIIDGCSDCFKKTRKSCSSYLTNREIVPVVYGQMLILRAFQADYFPKYVKPIHRRVAVVGRGKSFASSVEKVIRRSAEYDVIQRLGLEEDRFSYCVRRDNIGVRVFFAVPEMVKAVKEGGRLEDVSQGATAYCKKDKKLQLKLDDERTYNAKYIDIFSKHPHIFNKDDAELQVTSLVDFLHYEFCSEESRGLFDHFSPLRLRPKILKQYQGQIDEMADHHGGPDRAKEILDAMYRQRYTHYATRFSQFLDRLSSVFIEGAQLPVYMTDAAMLLEKTQRRISSFST